MELAVITGQSLVMVELIEQNLIVEVKDLMFIEMVIVVVQSIIVIAVLSLVEMVIQAILVLVQTVRVAPVLP